MERVVDDCSRSSSATITKTSAPISSRLDDRALGAVREEEREHKDDRRDEKQDDPQHRRNDALRTVDAVLPPFLAY
jgi:hypothetical protein